VPSFPFVGSARHLLDNLVVNRALVLGKTSEKGDGVLAFWIKSNYESIKDVAEAIHVNY
jgi:hypothetical protein